MRPAWIAKRTSAAMVRQWCPPRKQNTHKGNYGRVLILAGAEGYTGAPSLSAKAALRTGAGLIYLGVPRSVYPIVASKLDAPVVFPLPDTDGKLSLDALPEIRCRLETADACLLGPGLGRSEASDALVLEVIRCCKCPLVLDADGINAAAAHKDVLRGAACPLILTPHEGEFRRLTDVEEADRILGAEGLANDLGAIILRKGHETIVTNGMMTYVNHTGNAGMATGGSGDVLAGILVSLLGQGVTSLEAAATAAWLHGSAGDLTAEDLGQYAMGPEDLIESLPRLLP